MRVHHVNVIAPLERIAEVTDFYAEAFGFPRIDKPEELDPRGAWFRVDAETQLHVSVREGAPHPDPHFALVVDDLGAVAERLAGLRAPWSPAAPIFGGPRGYTRDPAGNRIELIQAPA